ncbi:hypothetical protein IFVP5_C1360183 [Vibrio parahaemolyticus]
MMTLKLSTQLRNLVSKQVLDHTQKQSMKRFAFNLYYCFIKILLFILLILRRK